MRGDSNPAVSGSGHHRWNGGRHVSRSGYVFVRADEHPNANAKGYVAEHAVVMESVLGRFLEHGENVHHKNGVKDDNRPENLELWVRTQPAGQRATDLLAWAKDIIAKYDAIERTGA